jgi:hypothetical protein
MVPNRGKITNVYRQERDDCKDHVSVINWGSQLAFSADPLAFQRRIANLGVFIRALLPAGDAPAALPSATESLLAITDSHPGSLTLPLIRQSMQHTHCWRENQAVPPHEFRVGDLGVVRDVSAGLGGGFEKFCNVIEDGLVSFDTAKEAFATRWSWKDFPMRREEMQPFPMGPDVFG